MVPGVDTEEAVTSLLGHRPVPRASSVPPKRSVMPTDFIFLR
jgi:hypothetical protein